MNKLLVTGGAGFIGSNFIRYWLKKYPKDKITNLDKLTYAGHVSSARDFEKNKNYKFIKGDICDPKVVDGAMKGIDIVTHFAAESIPENIYIPVKSATGIRVMTFGELWAQQRKSKKITVIKNVETMFYQKTQTRVLSYLNGGQWMPIKAITRHKYKGKVIKLNQKWGCIEATPNHSIYSSNLEVTNPLSNPELLVVRTTNKTREKYRKSNRDILNILAAYITEGNATFNKANGGYIVEIGQKNRHWLEDLGELIKRKFKLNFNISKAKKGTFECYHLQVSNKSFYKYILQSCGKYSDGKFLPDWIFMLKKEDKEFFWRKLCDGDGTTDGRYTTTSFKLANQISLLLTLLGKNFTFHEGNYLKYKRTYNFRTELEGSHYGLNLRKKTTYNYDGWVYDLEVGKTHNFVCGIGNVVCHNTHVDRSILGPQVFIKTNVIGTQILMDLALKHKVKRFHHISTDEVFGALSLGRGKFSESTRYDPRSPYSASKAASDHLVRAYHETFGLPATITNASNNFGPFQDPEKFLPRMITNLIDGGEIPIYGDGKYVRDWLHVDDHVRAIDRVLHKGKVGETYLVGGLTRDVNNLAIASKLLKIFKMDRRHLKFVKDRPGHDRRYAVDWGKIRKELGWTPKHEFDKWLDETVNWYKQNKWWWKPLKSKAEKLYAKTGQH